MRNNRLILKKFVLLALNVGIVASMTLSTSAVLSTIGVGRGRNLPDHAVTVDLQIEQLTVNQLAPEVSPIAAPEALRSALVQSREAFQLDVTVSGTADVYLTQTDTEVLADARVKLDYAPLGMSCDLRPRSPGVYACPFQQRLRLTSSAPLAAIDPGIAQWHLAPLGLRLNSRLQEAFSYTDTMATVIYQDRSPPMRLERPLEARVSAQLVDEQQTPLIGKTVSLELVTFNQSPAESITLTSDSQGIMTYRRSDPLVVSISGGRLTRLADPLHLPEVRYHTQLIDQRGRLHQLWAPIKADANTPPVVMFWGGGGTHRPPPDQRGKPETERGLGRDPYGNPEAAQDPISMTLGNVYSQVVDVTLPSRGLSIAFERTYNSLADDNGVLGFGWTHAYDLRVAWDESTETATVKFPDGRRLAFTRDPTGAFHPPQGEVVTFAKTSEGYTVTTKHGLRYELFPWGRLKAIIDRHDNAITCAYDANGDLVTITAAGGRALALLYDAKHRITALVLPNTQRITYRYDKEDNLIVVTDTAGAKTSYRYAPHHLLEQITDPNGHTRTFGYDWFSRCISFAYDYNNHKVSISYDEASQRTIVTDSKGQKTEYHYQLIEGIKLINKLVDPLGHAEETRWDASLNRTAVTDKHGTTTSMAYDGQDNVTSIGIPDPNTPGQPLVTRFTYEPTFNLVTSITDPLGKATQFTYDPTGNLTQTTDAAGKPTDFTYDPFGQLTSVTDSNGHATMFGYSLAGDLETVTDALGHATRFSYDAVGNRTAVTDANGNTTNFAYDANNRLATITYPDTTATTFTYDAAGNRTSVKDALGQGTTYTYDAVDRLVDVTDALTHRTAYQYDTEGNLIALIDAGGNTTRYEYDLLNRLTKTINAAGIATGYQYDPVGNRTQRTDGNRAVTGYTYDSLNRLTKITYADGSTVELTYDGLSRLSTMKDRQGTTLYAYDALGRLLSVDGPGANDTIRYEYDAVGNRLTLTDPDGKVIRAAYDEVNRLTTLTDPRAGTFTYTYDPLGNVTTLTRPNGLTTTYAYDRLNRLTALATSPPGRLATVQYTYDALGRRTTLTLPEATVDFAYDPTSQLTSERRTGTSPYARTYAYDPLGNRTAITRDTTTLLPTHNALNQLLEERRKSAQDATAVTVSGTLDDATAKVWVQSTPATLSAGQFQVSLTLPRGRHTLSAKAEDPAGNVSVHQITVDVVDPAVRTYQYDANGNLTEQTEGATPTTYAYDAENRLSQLDRSSARQQYAYDGQGRRVSVTEGGVTTQSLYDGLLPVTERQGPTTATNLWGLSYGGGIGGLLARTTASETLYPLYDGSGNILAWTNSAGAVVSSMVYSAFGEVLSQTGPVQPFGFSTKPTTSTGMVYFGARYYRPDLARWMTPDPLGMVDGPNVYLYVRNSPVNFIDPRGLDAIVLNDSDAVDLPFLGPQGHNAIAVGNDETGWDYYSQDGPSGGGGHRIHYGTAEELVGAQRQRYDRFFRIPTNPGQDQRMRAAAEQNLHTPYNANPYSQCRYHCGDLVNDTLETGGISHGPEEAFGNPPNDAFKKIRRANPPVRTKGR